MKYLLKKASLGLAMFALMANSALAQSGFFSNPQGGTGTVDVATTSSLGNAISSILNWFLGILGLVAVVIIIYAGVILLTSGGNQEAADKAKKIILYGVVGLIIIILSWTIVQFVVSALTN